MNLSAYKVSDLQNFRAVIANAMDAGVVDLAKTDALIELHISKLAGSVRPSPKRRPDNVTVCSICGKQAIIVPLSRSDRTAAATHAIQCQNRPATDQPWRDGMCGHTEYIVRGEK